MSIRKGDTMIAGSDRMWKGTAAELAAALAAHEIPEGKQVMVTDDYDNAYHPRPNWSAAVDIGTAIGTAAGFVCPSDGLIICTGNPEPPDIIGVLQINGISAGCAYWSEGVNQSVAFGWTFNVNCPVCKGDVVKHLNYIDLNPIAVLSPNSTDPRYVYKFVPWKD